VGASRPQSCVGTSPADRSSRAVELAPPMTRAPAPTHGRMDQTRRARAVIAYRSYQQCAASGRNFSRRTPGVVVWDSLDVPGGDTMVLAKVDRPRGRGVPLIMHQPFTVGLIQMRCSDDAEDNLSRACAMLRQASGRGAQVACLPELFRTRYFCQVEDA